MGLTNASGVVAAQRTYDAWGNRRTSSGSAPGNYQFAGAELDPTSGLYHMGARFYDPTIGRWLAEDPVQDKPFEPASLNFYAYVFNNPVLYVDPIGLEPPPTEAEKRLQDIITALTLLEHWLDGLRSRGVSKVKIGGRTFSVAEIQQALNSIGALARQLIPAGGVDAFLQAAFKIALRALVFGAALFVFGVALTLVGAGAIGMPIGQAGAIIAGVGLVAAVALGLHDVLWNRWKLDWKFWK